LGGFIEQINPSSLTNSIDFLKPSCFLKSILKNYGEVDIAVNGLEAVEAYKEALMEDEPYDVIFLDIMMPEMDGQAVLKEIRAFEEESDIFGREMVKIIMTTALDDSENIKTAFIEQCEGYIIKPIEREKIEKELKKIGLI